MSKERLEEIKENELVQAVMTPSVEREESHYMAMGEDVEWLIEQVGELELENKGHLKTLGDYETINKCLHDGRRKLRRQNKRYRDAFQDILVVLDWKTDNTSRLVKRLINKALEADK